MPWIFPKGKLPDGSSVADIEAVNDNFLPYVEVFNGRLDEHNLSGTLASTWTVAADYTSGTAWRIHLIEAENAGDDFNETSGGKDPADDMYRSAGGWQPVRAMTWTGVIRSTAVYVLASIHQDRSAFNFTHPQYGGGGSAQTTCSGLGSARYAIAIDGVVIQESIYGDMDDSQGPWMEHGARLTASPMVEALVPIVPGNHTIEVWVDVRRMTVPQASEAAMVVGRRTMFIWELD
jgi:hypothetical protein